MFDHLNFNLFLKVITAITVLVVVHQVFLASDDTEIISQPTKVNNAAAAQNKNFTLYADDEQPISDLSAASSAERSQAGSLEDLISMDLKLKYPNILASKTTISEEMLLTLTTKEKPLTSRTPIDLIWVIDNSGSMKGEKLRLLQDTLNYLLNLLSPQDRLSIIRFADDAKRLSPLKSVSKQNENFFKSVINNLFAWGGTNIGSGLSLALDVLKGRRYSGRIASIFILSDGLDNDRDADQKIQQLITEASGIGGYTIHSFGYGSDYDPRLMISIAKQRDGNFYFIEKLETADESFADALGGLATVVAEDVVIFVMPIESGSFPRVRIEKAFGGDLLWKRGENGWYETKINQLSSGKKKNYVLTLNLGPFIQGNPLDCRVAQARITYMNPGTGEKITKQTELKVEIIYDQIKYEQQQPDKELLRNYYRVKTGEAMHEADKLAEKGNYEAGKKKLAELKTELESSSLLDDDLVAGAVDDLETFVHEMHADAYKSKGKLNLMQNIGSYIEEKSNPYLSNSYLGFSSSNAVQRELVQDSRVRRKEL